MVIRLKYAHSSEDIGNHRYTNVQNYILLKYKCDKKNFPPPHPKPFCITDTCCFIFIFISNQAIMCSKLY